MVISNPLTRWLAGKCLPRADACVANREPHFVIPRLSDEVYLNRWFVIPRNRFFNVYLHEYWLDDEDRALHDHPWWSVSLCLKGRLEEVYLRRGAQCVRAIEAGDIVLRGAKFAHRLVVPEPGTTTLFITGPRLRTWGFLCARGWMDWRTFTARDSTGRAQGCGEMS